MDYTRTDLLALMGTAGALGRYGDAAAQDAVAAAALPLAAIVERNDAAVRATLQSQIDDPASQNRDTVPDQFGLHSAGSASGVVETMAASFVHPESAFHRSTALLERIRIAAGFLERAQSSTPRRRAEASRRERLYRRVHAVRSHGGLRVHVAPA